MTNREEELLELIRRNPAISQNELAAALGITRSSVAVHITNLIKKGYILGKGYLLKQDDYVSVLGGCNMDIIGFPVQKLVLQDSNPGKVKMALGGVGRNIAENLVHLGVPTKLISAVGEDIHGRRIMEHANKIGLDMKHTLVLNQVPTSTYLAILDETGDMKAGISQMEILEEITIDFIQNKKQIIEGSRLCIIDTNIPADVIHYVLDNFKNTEFFLDTVSSAKALKVKNKIGAFHTIKPNRIEAELLSGIEIKSQKDMLKAADYFLNQGVKRVFLSLGSEGVFYHDGKVHKLIPNPKVTVANATGAGDAFLAALAYGRFHDYDIDESARFSMAAAIMALNYEETINPNISDENVKKTMKETGLC
ncbi:winged helix-turn-helix transcriptional regulator [Anoxybacterium hadale]|uniref:Winged helix-turn-helix transcriptional regulator n=1 Tax=Anoxybacterium hadale TaxID=3408580 RepID=A0ACD1AB73_9FIRM|nr:winged helix-turn-helix transcriptional regulator [Clostridiales bacterium]